MRSTQRIAVLASACLLAMAIASQAAKPPPAAAGGTAAWTPSAPGAASNATDAAAIRGLAADLDSNPRRSGAKKALINIGPAAFPAVLAVFTNEQLRAETRVIAGEVLGELGDPRATGPFCEALTNNHVHIRTAAAAGLGKLGDPTTVEILMRAAIDEPDGRVRAAIYRSLGGCGDKRVVGLLVQMVRSDTSPHCEEALQQALDQATGQKFGGAHPQRMEWIKANHPDWLVVWKPPALHKSYAGVLKMALGGLLIGIGAIIWLATD